MPTSSLSLILLLASAVLGGGHHRPVAGCCDTCGVDSREVLAQILRLQSCRDEDDREDAAEDLREFDWRCHPEVVEALAAALLHDCDDDVREEAAESLAKMVPCMPVAHLALARAADCDSDFGTRHWARKGLRRISRCSAPCEICSPGALPPGPALGPRPWPQVEPPLTLPPSGTGLPPVSEPPYTPTMDLEPLPPVESPPAVEPLPPPLPEPPAADSPFLTPPVGMRRPSPPTLGDRQSPRKDPLTRLSSLLGRRLPRLDRDRNRYKED